MFAEDLTAFFDTVSGFAVAATRNAAAITNGLIADRPYLETLGVAEGSEPQALGIAADLVGVAHGDDIVISEGASAGTYKVRGVQPDGTGLVVLRLEAQ